MKWTPDFNAGAASHEVEAILNRFHLGYRSTALASGAFKLVSRPEDIRCVRSAWAALALEVADNVYIWHRTRTWRTLLEPHVISIDSAIGVAAVTLGSRAMTVESQRSGTAWTDRVLALRVAAVPLSDRRGLPLLTAAGIQLLPHLAWPPGRRRDLLPDLAIPMASAFAQSLLISSAMRRTGDRIDARASRWAGAELAVALAEETADFRTTVLGPSPDALRRLRNLFDVDRPAALQIAAEEERRLRAWLASDGGSGRAALPDDRPEQMEVVEAGIRRLSRRIQGGVRVVSSATDVVALSRRTHRDPRTARFAVAAIAIRGLVGAAVAADLLPRALGERAAQRVVSASDLVTIAATGAHHRAEDDDPRIGGWIERLVYEVAATSGAASGDAPELHLVHAAMSAIRAGFALTERAPDPERALRPRRQRLAAAANEVMIVHTTARQLRTVFEQSVAQARTLTASSIDLADRWTELDDLRVWQRAFVHDGIAQLLGALGTDLVDDRELRAWIDQELVRLDAALGRPTLSGDGDSNVDLDKALVGLTDEFGGRGLFLLTETWELPDWTRAVGATVVEIIREALNNILKHTGQEAAWCGALLQEDGTVMVRITDFATEGANYRPGSGTGTRSMISLAGIIDADIDWLRTPTGGTEVRLILHDPTDGWDT